MAVYTHLSLDEVTALLRRYGLGPARGLTGIPAGSINTNYFVDTDVARFFLRLCEVASAQELDYEAALLRHLEARGVPTPSLVLSDDGAPYVPLRGKFASVFRFVTGDERTAFTASASNLHSVGSAQASIHAAGADFTRRRPHAFELDSVTRWLHGIADARRAELCDVLETLREELTWRNGAGRRPTGLPVGVIHGDLFPDNAKLDPHGRVRLVFDFEMASDGVFAYDLAVTLNAWCFTSAFDWVRARALIEGYQQARPLSADERRALYGEARQSALRFTVTRIKDFHLRPVPAGDRVEKDFREYLRRLQALRTMGALAFDEALFG